MPLGDALIVMGKAPRAGRVKTRLCPPLPPRIASEIHACMLADTASEMASLRRVRRYLFVDPPEEVDSLRDSCFSGYGRYPQQGRDLGERMANAAGTAFRQGAERVVIVGTDCPALSAGRAAQAFRELRTGAGMVFGPAADGGFYLVGFSRSVPRLFRGIAWGGPTVLERIAARLRGSGTPFSFLPPERDVDVYEDLVAFRDWARTRRSPACPRTRRRVISFFASKERCAARGSGSGGFRPDSRSPRAG